MGKSKKKKAEPLSYRETWQLFNVAKGRLARAARAKDRRPQGDLGLCWRYGEVRQEGGRQEDTGGRCRSAAAG
jgi:hypothetical protein